MVYYSQIGLHYKLIRDIEGDTMKEDIEGIMRSTRRYWYQDGFVEIAIGLLFGLVGVGVYLQQVALGNPTLLIVLVVGLMAFILAGSLIVQWLVPRLKQRITYPRTGYVEYDHRRDRRARWLPIAVALALAILTLTIPDAFAGTGVIVGLLLCGILSYLAYRSSVWRLVVAAVVAVAVGIASHYLALSDLGGTALVFAVVGASLLIGGSLALIAYLRRSNPPPEAV